MKSITPLIILLLINLTASRSPTPMIVKCDPQQEKSENSNVCSITNRFYDVDSWQVERNRGLTKLSITDIQSESLPTALAESFPSLVSYSTSETTFKIAKKENFRNLKRLEVLELKNGQLTRIRRDAFEDLENLQRLDLGSNMIKLVSAEFFRNTGRLEFLAFNNNEVEEVLPKTFRNLLNLKAINAEGNQIYSIIEGTFENNQRLRSVSFKGNNLRFIDATTFHGLDELKTVDLRENQCIDKKYEVNAKVRKFLGAIRKDVVDSCQVGVKE